LNLARASRVSRISIPPLYDRQAPMALVSPELQANIDEMLKKERQGVAGTAATVRLVAAALFLALTFTGWQVTGGSDWSVYVIPMTLYASVSVLGFTFRRHPVVVSAAWFTTLLDVGLVCVVQLRTLPISRFPAGVAGFTLGIFSLLVALSALSLRGRLIYLTAVAAIGAQCVLMQAAHVTVMPMAAAAVVLLLEARTLHALTHRLQRFLRNLATAEVKRQFEARKIDELERAGHMIESLLAEAREKNAQLLKLQEDKERFSQLLVHDLRAPLTIIKSGLDLALQVVDRAQPPMDIAEDLHSSKTGVARLTGLINDLLGIAKLEESRLPLRVQSIALDVLLGEAEAQAARFDPRKKLVVEAVLAPGLAVNADPSLMRRVLENLVSNASRHTPEGRRLRVSAIRDGDHAILRVQNDGPCISPELRGRLFEKYQQATEARSGWGLGLYFCRLVLDAHGGTIAVEDAPGWNVSMVLRLPAAASSAAPSTAG
jgi:signal transduction histidine kinase